MNTFVFLSALLSCFMGEDPFPRVPAAPMQTRPIAVPAAVAKEPEVVNSAFSADNKTQVKINGILALHKRNYVVLAATERAVLMSLDTEKRDKDGNIVNDADGKPVMVPVIEGMPVFKGQVLGKFDDRELDSSRKIAEAQLDVAKAEKEKRIEVEYAKRGMRVAEAEVRMMSDANKRREGTFPQIEVLKAMLELKQAEANVDLQIYTIDEVKTREVTVRENELERTNVLIHLRRIIAPIDGIVVKLNQTEGEWLREGDPVLEIMQLKTLQFRGAVSVKDCAISDLEGKAATVSVTLAGGKSESFPGKIVFAHPNVAGAGTYDVYIEVQNRPAGNSWLLQPGSDADAVIQLR
ncbi:MAG: HlyD family efflux transporter periplasmic adaptor subunit [Planctomycetaceae bacterium]|jgi:multidrug efflux pump subunit AcrA (membrane-fusion protein)|nr:HlyD family efflux transporter periplasmic adaptor subunit [Planctomycetaceae bacterium]